MSAQQRMDPVDEFMPATPGIEEGSYKVKYLRCLGKVEGQYGEQNVHEFGFPELEGETIRYYTPVTMSKRTKQRNMVEAFLAREVEDGEQITPRDLRGKAAEAFIEINARGYPAIKSLAKLRKPSARRAPAPEPDDEDPDPFAVEDEAAE